MRTCSAPLYKLPSGTNTLLLDEKEVRASNRKDSGEARSESEEREIAEPRLAFDI